MGITEKIAGEKITLAHGSGGIQMHNLIRSLFQKRFRNEWLDQMSDSAVIGNPVGDGDALCFTTDSYVVSPLFFPGGDIGKLAVCGTVNDLAVEGATPLFLSCGFIVEEGCEILVLEKVADSMADAARAAGVKIVAGDFKVVEKGKADSIFINTSGIGRRSRSRCFGREHIRAGDKVLINGFIGEHGAAVMAARGNFDLQSDIKSDCAPLNGIISDMLAVSEGIRFMRDPTRGGIATTLNEIAEGANFGITLDEAALPLRDDVKAACEILGFDPLYLANEGKVIAIVSAEDSSCVLDALRSHTLGRESRIIGEVTASHAGRVVMKTLLGAHRIIDMLSGEQLPRIC